VGNVAWREILPPFWRMQGWQSRPASLGGRSSTKNSKNTEEMLSFLKGRLLGFVTRHPGQEFAQSARYEFQVHHKTR
jgi:hypothetical protein